MNHPQSPPSTCPVCGGTILGCRDQPLGCFCDCENCGRFVISVRALAVLQGRPREEKAVLSHQIWLNQSPDAGKPYEVMCTHLDRIKEYGLPNPAEQMENLILYWGNQQNGILSGKLDYPESSLRAKTGSLINADVGVVAEEAISQGLIDGQASDRQASDRQVQGRLTFKGWKRYQEIKRGVTDGRTVFMAMPFRLPEVREIVDNVFKAAVAETGFRLKRLDDEPAAGPIDDRLRVEIRMCRFLIADLTDENRGAYWEAGYAEGLGKPVIYTCKKDYFDEHGTHFDTNHRQTVLWDPAHPERAATDLMATIRATLPFEAKMPSD